MLKQAIDQYAFTLNKQWSHDRSKTVGASEIGNCARKTFWIKNEGTGKGAKRDAEWEEQYGARVRGTLMEQVFWEPALKARFGDNLLHSGEMQKTIQHGHISATPDALIINQPRDALKQLGIADIEADCFMAEGKTIDPRTNLLEAKTENVFQVHVQLGLTRETSTFYQPMYSVLTYMDASFWSEVIEYPIRFDPAIYQAAKDRATVIMTATHAVELPAEGWIAGGRECGYCPFVTACGVERRSVPRNNKPADKQFVAEIADLCSEANQAEVTMKTAQSHFKGMQEQIKTRLREKGVNRINGVVNWYEVAGHTVYSPTRMRDHLTELGEDPEQFAKTSKPYDVLAIAAIPAATPGFLMPGKLQPRKAKTHVKSKTRRTGKRATGKRKRTATTRVVTRSHKTGKA